MAINKNGKSGEIFVMSNRIMCKHVKVTNYILSDFRHFMKKNLDVPKLSNIILAFTVCSLNMYVLPKIVVE